MATKALRLLQGRRPLIQPHKLRPAVLDQLTQRPVQAAFDGLGVELPSVNLRCTFTKDELETIKQASDDAGGIIVFTNQDPSMTIHDHLRFAKQMAASDDTVIEPHSVAKGHPDAPEVLEIVREPSAGVVFGENWHSDNSFHAETCSYSILRGAVVPRLGVNDTLFSSTETAFEAMTPTMQNLLLDLNAYHSASKAYGAGHPGNSRAAMSDTSSMQLREEAPILEADVLQPLVSVHPRTGRRGLFVSPTFTTRIDGMSPEESTAILRFVYEWIARPEFCTRVSWMPNQVVMWDNRSLSHKGLADDVSERRVVQRVSIRGSAPVNHRGQAFSMHRVAPVAAGLFDWEKPRREERTRPAGAAAAAWRPGGPSDRPLGRREMEAI